MVVVGETISAVLGVICGVLVLYGQRRLVDLDDCRHVVQLCSKNRHSAGVNLIDACWFQLIDESSVALVALNEALSMAMSSST